MDVGIDESWIESVEDVRRGQADRHPLAEYDGNFLFDAEVGGKICRHRVSVIRPHQMTEFIDV